MDESVAAIPNINIARNYFGNNEFYAFIECPNCAEITLISYRQYKGYKKIHCSSCLVNFFYREIIEEGIADA